MPTSSSWSDKSADPERRRYARSMNLILPLGATALALYLWLGLPAT